MAVLKGEGRVPMIFGTAALPVPPNRTAYIARPDVEGEHPSVIVAHDQTGVTPGVKVIARHFARYGYSAIVPDLNRGSMSDGDGFEWAVSDLADGVESVRIPGTGWAAESRIAVLGIGVGGVPASIVAAESEVGCLVLVGAALEAELLSAFGGALLVLQGADDELAPADEVRDLQKSLGRGEWILYPGVGSGFLDESAEGFDAVVSADALSRIIGFLDQCFGEAIAS